LGKYKENFKLKGIKMSHFEKGQRVNLIDDPEQEIFIVLIPEPDISGDVVVMDDVGQYLMVDAKSLEVVTQSFTGKFWLSTNGQVYFAVTDASEAWNCGFKQFEGIVDKPETMPGFKKFLTEIIEVEYK
jgi:hypothetical protein